MDHYSALTSSAFGGGYFSLQLNHLNVSSARDQDEISCDDTVSVLSMVTDKISPRLEQGPAPLSGDNTHPIAPVFSFVDGVAPVEDKQCPPRSASSGGLLSNLDTLSINANHHPYSLGVHAHLDSLSELSGEVEEAKMTFSNTTISNTFQDDRSETPDPSSINSLDTYSGIFQFENGPAEQPSAHLLPVHNQMDHIHKANGVITQKSNSSSSSGNECTQSSAASEYTKSINTRNTRNTQRSHQSSPGTITMDTMTSTVPGHPTLPGHSMMMNSNQTMIFGGHPYAARIHEFESSDTHITTTFDDDDDDDRGTATLNTLNSNTLMMDNEFEDNLNLNVMDPDDLISQELGDNDYDDDSDNDHHHVEDRLMNQSICIGKLNRLNRSHSTQLIDDNDNDNERDSDNDDDDDDDDDEKAFIDRNRPRNRIRNASKQVSRLRIIISSDVHHHNEISENTPKTPVIAAESLYSPLIPSPQSSEFPMSPSFPFDLNSMPMADGIDVVLNELVYLYTENNSYSNVTVQHLL